MMPLRRLLLSSMSDRSNPSKIIVAVLATQSADRSIKMTRRPIWH